MSRDKPKFLSSKQSILSLLPTPQICSVTYPRPTPPDLFRHLHLTLRPNVFPHSKLPSQSSTPLNLHLVLDHPRPEHQRSHHALVIIHLESRHLRTVTSVSALFPLNLS